MIPPQQWLTEFVPNETEKIAVQFSFFVIGAILKELLEMFALMSTA